MNTYTLIEHAYVPVPMYGSDSSPCRRPNSGEDLSLSDGYVYSEQLSLDQRDAYTPTVNADVGGTRGWLYTVGAGLDSDALWVATSLC